MRFEKTDVWGFEHAIRGMRNPMESWNKSDSEYDYDPLASMADTRKYFYVGKNDMDLMQRLIRGGEPHRKFLRQIFVSVDITAPLYWWKEFDTYKIGTTANSTSTMHKLATTPITIDCFEMDDFQDFSCHSFATEEDRQFSNALNDLIKTYENLRQKYLETKDKKYWKELIRWLPESWLQTRTVTMNYENILTMCYWRKNHKLSEWHQFVDWAHTLPYAKKLLFLDEEGD